MQLKDGYVYWQTGEDIQLTPHFNSAEFECPEPDVTGTHRVSIELLGVLEAVRNDFGMPIIITSAYRTAAYQAALRVKGYETAVNTSSHELGNAVDISTKGLPAADLIRLDNILSNHFKAIGRAYTFIHVDTRRDKTRLWTYAKR